MSFRTYSEGLKIATDTANRAIQAESSLTSLGPLASPLPTLQKAFRLYISAAEAYSHLIGSNLAPASERPNLQKKWRLVLERAEKIKKRVQELGGTVGKVDVGDEGIEGSIVRRGGLLHGVQTSIWNEPGGWEFTGQEFKSSQQPELGKEQMDLEPVWIAAEASDWGPMKSTERWVVRQGLGADCSVVAGLSACLEHDRKWKTSLAMGNLWPRAITGQPIHSENGKHIIKMMLNGAWRGMIIDALLPWSKQMIPLSPTPKLLLPTKSASANPPPGIPLLLKAYFLTHGGFSLRGSNPAPDIYALTGWIPERISLKEGFQREKEWDRLIKAWREGQVLMTLGSGKTSGDLVPFHAFAVLDLNDIDGERSLELYDPGLPPDTSKDGELSASMDGLSLGNRKNGLFTMSWDEVCTNFEALNLNWDPAVRSVMIERHWSWAKPPQSGDSSDYTADPRYRLNVTTTEDCEVWLLLSQHIHTTDRPMDDIALHVIADDASRQPQIIGGMNPYANAQHVLVRQAVRAGSSTLAVIPSRDRGLSRTDFTLRAFAPAGSTMSLERVSRELAFSQTIQGSLTTKTSGGHPGWPSFGDNLQHKVSLKQGGSSQIRVALKGDNAIAWGIKLLHSNGERVHSIDTPSVVIDSGPYSYGMAYVDGQIEAGTYTLIVSTFEPGQIGSFTLNVESSNSLLVSPIPAEGAGMYARSIEGRWTDETAGGRPSAGHYESNPRIEMVLPKPATLIARLHHPKPSATPEALNLTMFARKAGGDIGGQIATSGPYSDIISGVRIPRTKVEAGGYVLVPSCYERGSAKGESWRVDIWSDTAITVELVK